MASPVSKKCFECDTDNPDNAYCGACGAPLEIGAFIGVKVKENLDKSLTDRNLVETESAVRVFERAFGWMRLLFYIAAALLAIAGGGIFWKAADVWHSADTAKQSIVDTAAKTNIQITGAATKAKREIAARLGAAESKITLAADESARRAAATQDSLRRAQVSVAAMSGALSNQSAALRREIDSSRQSLNEVLGMEPELKSLRTQLEAQQKTLSSSENFVRSVFSTHTTEIFHVGSRQGGTSFDVVAPPVVGSRTTIFLLLHATPIKNTLQLQFNIYAQPPNSFFAVHNLVIFFWGDSVDTLKSQQLSVSYFPDGEDKNIIHTLDQRDGRVYADGEPLPKLNQADPDFKGDSWFSVDGAQIRLKCGKLPDSC